MAVSDTSRLTDTDRDNIAEARRVGALLRASDGDANRLAGWLLAELADLAERLGGGGPVTCTQTRSPTAIGSR